MQPYEFIEFITHLFIYIAALQFFLEEMYTLNEFYVQDVLGYTQLFLEEISMR